MMKLQNISGIFDACHIQYIQSLTKCMSTIDEPSKNIRNDCHVQYIKSLTKCFSTILNSSQRKPIYLNVRKYVVAIMEH